MAIGRARQYSEGHRPLRHPSNCFGRSIGRRVRPSIHGRNRRHMLSHTQLFSLIPFPLPAMRETFIAAVNGYRDRIDGSFPDSYHDQDSFYFANYRSQRISNTPVWLLALGLHAVNPVYTIEVVSRHVLGTAADDAYLIEGKVNSHLKGQRNSERLRNTSVAAYPLLETLRVVGRHGHEDPFLTTVLYLPSCGMMCTVFAPNHFSEARCGGHFRFSLLPSSYLRIRESDGDVAFGGFFERGSIRTVCRIRFNAPSIWQPTVHHWPDSLIQLVPDYFDVEGAYKSKKIAPKDVLFLEDWDIMPAVERRTIWHDMMISAKTYGPIKRQYVHHLLYRNMELAALNYPFVIDLRLHPFHSSIVFRVVGNRHGRDLISEVSTIRITRINFDDPRFKEFDRRATNIQAILRHRGMRNAVRTNDGSLGRMIAIGKHWHNNKVYLYPETRELDRDGDLQGFMKEYMKLLVHLCPLEAFVLRGLAANHGHQPPPEMGGMDGLTLSMNVSRNLGNTPHYDTADKGPGISIWREDIPNMSTNWNFVMPNVVFEGQDRHSLAYGGVYVKLCHGALIQWDGVAIRHCTSITDIGDDGMNSVYGFHVTNNSRSLDGLARLAIQDSALGH